MQGIEVRKKVADATYSYAGQIAQSGIVDLGKTTGHALANTTNRHALNAVQGALDRAGLARTDLPRPVQRWLQTKDKIDEAKAKALEVQKAREARKWKERLVEAGQVVEAPSQGPFVPAQTAFDSDSEITTIERDGDGSVRRTSFTRRTSTASRTASAINPDMILDDAGYRPSADAVFASNFVNSGGSATWGDHENSMPNSPQAQASRRRSWKDQFTGDNAHSRVAPMSPTIASPGRRGSLLQDITGAASIGLDDSLPPV